MAQVVRPPQLRVADIEQPGQLLLTGSQRAALLDHLDLAGEVLGRQRPAKCSIAGHGGIELHAVAQLGGGVADRLGVQQQLFDTGWAGGDQLDR